MPARSELPLAVVTGASRGIGIEVCRQLAALGYIVVLGSRDLREAELAAKELDPNGERVIPAHSRSIIRSTSISSRSGYAGGGAGSTRS